MAVESLLAPEVTTGNIPLDYVTIHGLTLQTRIGCTAEERATPQPLILFIEMGLPSTRERARGELSSTICWQQVKEQVATLVTAHEWILVEDLIEDLAALIFEFSPIPVRLNFEIQKGSHHPPAAQYVTVRASRFRRQ